MAYSTLNPPQLLARPMATQTSTLAVLGSTSASGNVFGGNGIWMYSSTDTSTLLQAAGYFTNGKDLGMRIGDILMNVYASSLGATPSAVQVGCLVTTNSTAGFNVATGAAIASS